MVGFANYAGPWIVQVNDYEVATLWRHACDTLVRYGPRKLAALAWRRRQEKKLLPTCARVICNSEATRRRVVQAYRLDPDKVICLHKAADVQLFLRPERLPRRPLPDWPDGTRLLFVGTNWALKGLDVLLRALGQVPDALPPIRLAVAGRDPARVGRKIETLCKTLGLSDRVLFLGPVEHAMMPDILWHSDVFVLPSRMEAFGVAVVEALAAGVPVVATRVGGIPEIIRDGVDGVLCEPESPGELAAAISRVFSDASLRERLARAGPPRAAEFGLERMVQQVRKLYLDVLNERTGN